MKNQRHKIQQYALSPWAKAGMAIRELQGEANPGDHDNSKPHRDDHYLLILMTQGQLNINLDFQVTTMKAPALLMIFPGQVHHTIDIRNPEGWAISFDASLLENGLQLLLDQAMKGQMTLDGHADFYHQAVTLMNLMMQLQAKGFSGHSVKAAHSLLNALLELLAEKTTSSAAGGSTPQPARATIIAQSFDQLLKQHYRDWKQPSQYAAALNISVAHLYDTVKGITGTSVSELIQQRAVLEAKRLLYFTDLSVKEIGYETGYNEPVYFGKLFKKISGSSPLQFRKQYRD